MDRDAPHLFASADVVLGNPVSAFPGMRQRDIRAVSEDLVAIPQVSPAPAASDYDAIFAALMQTERGRWFLQEYARQNRSADTKLLLSAIERIEAVVCAERNRQAQHNLRTDLIEMAAAITQTRAEVAETSPIGSGRPARQPPAEDVFAAAERIRDVTWAMRGHGFDPSTCEQLEELAATILSASALRDPTDSRARKLREVLHYLEQRITQLIDSCAEGDAPVAPAGDGAPERTPDAEAPAPSAVTERRNGSAGALVTQSRASRGAEDYGPLGPSPQIRIPDSLTAVHDDIGEDTLAAPPTPAEMQPLDPPLPANGDHEARARSANPDGAARAGLPASPEALAQPLIAEPDPLVLPSAAEAAIAVFSAELAELAALDPGPPAPRRLPPPPAAQPRIGDPLALLKAMSADELIALFS